ncbi:MAG: xanthine dehydrogenase family protein molybdopterin-binding subunit [Syntrophorhabdales bacterium]|jgi:4-hydroxybenzoyl-CoA reductase subunit alpha
MKQRDLRSEYSVVGRGVPRVDGWAKVTGDAIYSADVYLKGMLRGKILRSPHPHARIVHIDTSRARRLTGVRAVVTGADTPGVKYAQRMKTKVPDKAPLAIDKVRYIGDEVAAVAADDVDVAEEALDLIRVDYDVLPAVYDPFEAMKPGAPQIHEHAPGNIAWSRLFQWGRLVDELLEECEVVVEDSFKTQGQVHAYMEPNCSVATWDQNGNVTVWATTQGPHTHKEEIVIALGLPENKVRVITPNLGGGFGGKRHVVEPSIAAILLSKMSGRPVKIEYTRVEEFTAARHRHPMNIKLRIGAKKNGRLIFFDAQNIVDNGAYNDSGPSITLYAGHALTTNYRVEGVRYDPKLVYTNTAYGGAYRGYGNLQMRFALESMLDILAERLEMDSAELRMMNAVEENDVLVCKSRVTSCGLRECIDEVVRSSNWSEKRKNSSGKLRGVGISCHEYVCGVRWHYPHDSSSAHVRIDEDGSVKLFTGTVDIGQGSDTTLCQIVAEVLGVDMSQINIYKADTELTPLDLGTYGSRVTFIAGNATKIAATEARNQLAEVIAEELDTSPESIEFRNNRVQKAGAPETGFSFREAAKLALNKKGLTIMGRGSYDPPSDIVDFDKGEGKFNATYSFGAQIAEVEVDPVTGRVNLEKIYSAVDCGFAINPLSLEGQCHGSISHAQGMALFERPLFHDGKVLTPSFLDYHIPTSMETPDVDNIFVETIDPDGPYGAKGVCEGYQVPTAPAIINAIYNATGVRIKELPVNPEEVLRGLAEHPRESKGDRNDETTGNADCE